MKYVSFLLLASCGWGDSKEVTDVVCRDSVYILSFYGYASVQCDERKTLEVINDKVLCRCPMKP